MFEAIFQEIERSLPGVLAAAIVGDDGMEVECHVCEEVPHEVMSAELNGVMRNLHRIQEEQDLGRIGEVVIRTEKQNILLVSLAGGLFLLLATAPGVPTGKARYEVQRRMHRFAELLS